MDNKIYQNVDQTAKCWYIDKKTTSKKEKKKNSTRKIYFDLLNLVYKELSDFSLSLVFLKK